MAPPVNMIISRLYLYKFSHQMQHKFIGPPTSLVVVAQLLIRGVGEWVVGGLHHHKQRVLVSCGMSPTVTGKKSVKAFTSRILVRQCGYKEQVQSRGQSTESEPQKLLFLALPLRAGLC